MDTRDIKVVKMVKYQLGFTSKLNSGCKYFSALFQKRLRNSFERDPSLFVKYPKNVSLDDY